MKTTHLNSSRYCTLATSGRTVRPSLFWMSLANLKRELEAADSLSKTPGSHAEACVGRVGVGHTDPVSHRTTTKIQPRQGAARALVEVETSGDKGRPRIKPSMLCRLTSTAQDRIMLSTPIMSVGVDTLHTGKFWQVS